MQTVLNKFTTEHLFDASAAMLSHLKIKFTPQTKTPIPFEDLYTGATSSPLTMSLSDVLKKVRESFFIGTIDEDSLAGRDSDFDLKQEVDGKYQTMLVFAVEINAGERLSRSELATLTRGFNRMASSLPIIVFIKKDNRLSLATCERSQYRQNWRDGEKLGKVAILRNIDCNKVHRGHIDILESLGDKAYSTFDDLYAHWLEVFSSELLTKKFYTELSEWYAWVISSGKVKFPNNINSADDDSKYNHENVIRLITRLIFVWFLKQKKLIPEEFFDENAIRENFIENFDPHSTNTLFYDPEQSKYYRLILQNLFFAMLNRPIMDEETGNDENRRFRISNRHRGGSFNADFNVNNLLRYEAEFKPGGAKRLLEVANSQVPFLSGGLFECLDHKDKEDPEYGMYYDGFSELKASLEQLSFPDYFFFGDEVGSDVDLSKWYDDKKKAHSKVRGLIDILRRYNFTVEENTPLDQEVSLDPELLGKVFENLLASYNPETNKTARKQTGSFYTPREVVQFMVNESLIEHLCRICGAENKERYRSLLSYSTGNIGFTDEETTAIIKALHNCKILDPACGSGAFPMGVLQQMVHALRKLDPSNERWKDFILEIAVGKDKEAYKNSVSKEELEARRRDIEEAFNRSINDPDYARKLYLIENCIYGVDLQPIAVQISKLRFFISLVADQKPSSDPVNNFGIRPLPNLEAKFVAANTLISLPKQDNNLFAVNDALDRIKNDLSKANHKLFLAKSNKEKRSIIKKIRNLREQFANKLESVDIIRESSAQLIASWDMFDPNKFASFFDSEWMFGLSEGFDIVIGNPPYIQLQSNKGELAKLYGNCSFSTFARTGDIYCLFYERGNDLLKQGGHLCFITSNKWMRAAYGEKTRSYFAKNTNPVMLIDFGGVKIFESATVDTNVLLFAKGKNEKSTICAVVNKQNKDSVKNLSDFVQQNGTNLSFNTSDSWVILSPIEQSIKSKIEAVGTPLKDWDIQINYGIKTGYNDAFIISTETRDEILSNCADEEERKRTDELIRPILRGRDIKRYGYDWAGLYLIATFPSRHYDIEEYPAVKAHLLSFGKERLEQTGKNYKINGEDIKARKKTNNKWFETQDSISYWEDFFKPKIIYPETTQGAFFANDETGIFLDKTCFMMVTKQAHYIQATLSSQLFEFAYKRIFSSIELGQHGYQYNKHALLKLPIKDLKVNDAIDYNDEFFYKHYNITKDEIEYIRNFVIDE